MNKLQKAFVMLLRKPRWKEYESILSYAVSKGYNVTSLIDWYENLKGNPQAKVLIMRHDVDNDPHGAAKMHEIEKKLGVHSTFYFRWSTIEAALIEDIKTYGSEVGLHYETLADYAIEHNIYRGEEITPAIIEECRHTLKEEIKKFKEMFGEIKSISAHGAGRNEMLSTPNNVLVEGENLDEYGVVISAYNKEIHDLFDIYISDGSVFDGYWRYGVSPVEAIDEGRRVICCLTHPCNWNYNLARNFRDLFRVALRRVATIGKCLGGYKREV